MEEVSVEVKTKCLNGFIAESPESGKPLSLGVSLRMKTKGKLTGRYTDKTEIF